MELDEIRKEVVIFEGIELFVVGRYYPEFKSFKAMFEIEQVYCEGFNITELIKGFELYIDSYEELHGKYKSIFHVLEDTTITKIKKNEVERKS